MAIFISEKKGRIANNQGINIFKQKIFDCIKTCFNFYCQKDQLLKEKYFIDFRLIKKNFGHHFYFICACKEKYVNRYWK